MLTTSTGLHCSKIRRFDRQKSLDELNIQSYFEPLGDTEDKKWSETRDCRLLIKSRNQTDPETFSDLPCCDEIQSILSTRARAFQSP